MRLAFTHPQAGDLGGVERQAHSLAVALCDAGHEVHFFCERADGSVDPRIELHVLRRWVRPIKSLKVVLFDARVERAVARAGPFDVVQGFGKTSRQDVYYDGSGCLADFQGYSIDTLPGAWRRALRRASPYQAAVGRIERARYTRGNYRRIVAISELVRGQILARHGVPPGDVEVVHPGVDLERFRPAGPEGSREAVRGELGLGEGVPLLAFVGNDYRRKGLDALLRALVRLPEAHALVIGRDKNEGAYREYAAGLGVGSRVHLLGLRPDPERWLAAADCLVFPSHFDAFGSAVLEGLACGLPAVVSRRAGAAELVVEGKTGALVDGPEDVEALARAVKPFLDRVHRQEAGRDARAEAEGRGWQRHTARMLEIYREIGASSDGSLV
jgi:UDP-glucose:(heptosyl)LPS alpha-1,3-glucosyltransferase